LNNRSVDSFGEVLLFDYPGALESVPRDGFGERLICFWYRSGPFPPKILTFPSSPTLARAPRKPTLKRGPLFDTLSRTPGSNRKDFLKNHPMAYLRLFLERAVT
jgi:hypothetical protein